MTDSEPARGVDHDANRGDGDVDRDLERANRMLERRLRRMESNVRSLEEFQESNSRLLSSVMAELDAERARSRQLLLNVLPDRIVARLEHGERPIADRHDDVAVLFSDLAHFTEIASSLEPTVLIAELNDLFAGFDRICQAHHVEPIKTIGDAYLGIAGLVGGGDPAVSVAEAAIEMAGYVARRAGGAAGWRIRIGLHVGPIVAGVVGASRFAYDVWGDTVNVASRLETASEPGRIHVSAAVAQRLGPGLVVERRGTVELKGKGAMETYWLVGRQAPTRACSRGAGRPRTSTGA